MIGFLRNARREWRARRLQKYPLVLHSDRAGWVLDGVAADLRRHLPARCRAAISCGDDLHRLRDRAVHFLGQFDVFGRERLEGVHESNRLAATWWHGGSGSRDEAVRRAFETVPRWAQRLHRIVVSCSISEDVLKAAGIPGQRIVRLPLGVDTRVFRPAGPDARGEVRRRLGLPPDAFCVGSFQKDGVGWGEGLEPKWVKGPDVLVEVLGRLRGEGVHALLAGPARGYVVRGLTERGVPFTYVGRVSRRRLRALYHALDVYLITSREEGGPLALLEAMASGVPIVSTRVGMAPDALRERASGFIVDVDDVEALTDRVRALQRDAVLRAALADASAAAAVQNDWRLVARLGFEKLYRGMLPPQEAAR